MKLKYYLLLLVLGIIILTLLPVAKKKEKVIEFENYRVTILPLISLKELKEKHKYCDFAYTGILACNINNTLIYFIKNNTNILKIEFKMFPEKNIEWFYNETKDIIKILYTKRKPLPAMEGLIYKIYVYNLTKEKVEKITEKLAIDIIDQFENKTCFTRIISTYKGVITFDTCKNLITITYLSQ